MNMKELTIAFSFSLSCYKQERIKNTAKFAENKSRKSERPNTRLFTIYKKCCNKDDFKMRIMHLSLTTFHRIFMNLWDMQINHYTDTQSRKS